MRYTIRFSRAIALFLAAGCSDDSAGTGTPEHVASSAPPTSHSESGLPASPGESDVPSVPSPREVTPSGNGPCYELLVCCATLSAKFQQLCWVTRQLVEQGITVGFACQGDLDDLRLNGYCRDDEEPVTSFTSSTSSSQWDPGEGPDAGHPDAGVLDAQTTTDSTVTPPIDGGRSLDASISDDAFN